MNDLLWSTVSTRIGPDPLKPYTSALKHLSWTPLATLESLIRSLSLKLTFRFSASVYCVNSFEKEKEVPSLIMFLDW